MYKWIACLLLLSFLGCDKDRDTSRRVYGKVMQSAFTHTDLGNYLLLVSIEDVEEYNSLYKRTDSHEVAYFNTFKVNGDSIRLDSVYRVPCWTEGILKLRYTDRILEISEHLLYYDCVSDGYFSVVDIRTGKEITNQRRLMNEREELKSGIVEREVRNYSPTMLISTSNGKKHVLNYKTLAIEPYNGENFNMDSGWGDKPTFVQTASIGDNNCYFELNANDNLSKLVVRSKHSGTSQSRLYTRGEELIHPAFLPNSATGKALCTEDLLVVHGSVWTDAQDRDLLSKVSLEGKKLWTCNLASLQTGPNSSYYNSDGFLYAVGGKGIAVVNLSTGKLIKILKRGVDW